MQKILLFIPMYNCEKQIIRVLNQLNADVCEHLSEVLIVNNRSTDGGEKAVQNYLQKMHMATPVTLLRNDENYGLGGSHKVAFNYAVENAFDYVIVLHGDDQGNIRDLLPILKSKKYTEYDCCLGARFMKGAVLSGYSAFRTFGNHIFNAFFSLVLGKRIYDLGAGLKIYSTAMLKSKFYYKYPDSLTFDCCMDMALVEYKQSYMFFPISWREDDQISNVKLFSQAKTTLKMLFSYAMHKTEYLNSDLRDKQISEYTATVVSKGKY